LLEQDVEIKLWDWLIKNNSFIKQIYFNRKNKINIPTFQTKGINKKPDFLIDLDRGYGSKFIAIEIKTIKKSKDIYDASKILDYYKNYLLSKTKYYINNKEIKINHFAIATENSPIGRLFKEDNIIVDNENREDEWAKINSQLKLIPRYEYMKTRDFLRNLWASWRRLRKELLFQEAPSIGIIINYENVPILFTMIYVNWLKTKRARWGQRFWRI